MSRPTRTHTYLGRLMVRKRWPLTLTLLLGLVLSTVMLGVRLGDMDLCKASDWADSLTQLFIVGVFLVTIFGLGATVPLDRQEREKWPDVEGENGPPPQTES